MTARLGDRYALRSRIARGGMGEVWRAHDELLSREVAVKLLHQLDPGPADQNTADWIARFRNEARITAGLTHPGIAQVFDYGEQSDLAYLVMELVHGEPLSAVLARNGALGAEITLDILQQAARALHFAHLAGVIHRDVKPGNLLVTPEGTIKVTDFGIARVLESPSVTMTGTVLGTAQYASPEQAQGLPLTPATDLYSLGVVAYECLTGRPPFVAETQVAIALLHLNEPPAPLGAAVPAPVRDLVMRLLAKAPEHRFATAALLAERASVLAETLAGATAPTELGLLTDPAGSAAAGTPRTTARTQRRPRTGSALVFLVTAGAVAAVILIAAISAGVPNIINPVEPMTNEPTVTPVTTKPRIRQPSAVSGTPTKPVPSPSATVSKTASPTGSQTTSSPTPTRTPTRTPTTTPTSPPSTGTPTDPPEPGGTNPPEE